MNELIGFRDAIHVPFIVVRSGEQLSPGDKCSLREENYCVKWWNIFGEPIWHGVVDPFVEQPFLPGTPFRLFIRKDCYSALRHVFEIEVHDRGGTDTCHEVCNVW